MYVIKVEDTQRKLYFVNENRSCTFMGDLHSAANDDLRRIGFVLLLDHMHYFDLSLRKRLIEVELALLGIPPIRVVSSMEAVAAFIKTEHPEIGNLHIVDILRQGTANIYNARFINNQYVLHSCSENFNLQLEANFREHLRIEFTRLNEFESFLQSTYGQYTYEQIVVQLMNKLERDNSLTEDEITILKMADVQDITWQNITIADLVRFRKNLRSRITPNGQNNTVIFLGVLSNILNNHEGNNAADILGAAYIHQIQHELYGPLMENVSLRVYSFDYYFIPLFEKNSTYQEYSTAKTFRLYNTGIFDFIKGNQLLPYQIPENSPNYQLKLVDVSISMDPNHNLLITVGNNTYLHDLHQIKNGQR